MSEHMNASAWLAISSLIQSWLPLPREWCHPQWVSLPISVMIKTLRHGCAWGQHDLDDPSLMPFSQVIFDCATLIFKTNHHTLSLACSPGPGPLVPHSSHFMLHNTPLIHQLYSTQGTAQT